MRLRLDQLRQLLAGVKHAGLHGRGRDAKMSAQSSTDFS